MEFVKAKFAYRLHSGPLSRACGAYNERVSLHALYAARWYFQTGDDIAQMGDTGGLCRHDEVV